jgi:dihydrofolate synthase/folylpolyglutamate synthase
MNILGNTLELIAAEKGGIIKPNTPVIIGESSIITDPVLENIAKSKQAPVHYASYNRSVAGWKWNKHDLVVEVEEKHQTDHKKYQLDLPGIYQKKNLITVLETCAVLHEMGWRTNEANTRKALKQVKKLTGLHGRWELIHSDPSVILDVAHNEDGMNQLMQQIELTDHKDLHIIIGMVKDKEIPNVLSELPHTAKYYFTQADIPRALDAQTLKNLADKYRLKGEAYRSVNHALRRALAVAHPSDLVIVCGSVTSGKAPRRSRASTIQVTCMD